MHSGPTDWECRPAEQQMPPCRTQEACVEALGKAQLPPVLAETAVQAAPAESGTCQSGVAPHLSAAAQSYWVRHCWDPLERSLHSPGLWCFLVRSLQRR